MTDSASNKIQLTPYFTVIDADRFIDFMTAVFRAETVKENRHLDGTIQHVRLKIGDSIIMLNQANTDYSSNQSQMHFYVDSIEDTYNLALTNGAISLMSPMLRPHGDRMAGFKDPYGNVWWVAEKNNCGSS